MRLWRAVTHEEGEVARGKQLLIVFVAACFYYSGLVKLARWWTRRSGPRLIILNYHHASGGDLRHHLLYLRRHYRMMLLEEALEELYAPPKESKQKRDRRTPLVLTFDDGYRDNYTHGFALASKLQVPLTIFLIPGYIENGNCFWWLDRLVHHARVKEVTVEGHAYHLNQQEERIALAQAIDARANSAVSIVEKKEFLVSVRKVLEVPSSVVHEEEPAPLLTWAEVKEMEKSGWVSFGAHTVHHPVLAYLIDPAEVRFEVEECRAILERQLGHPVRTFAYPFGRSEHIGEEALRAVQEAAYDWAVTTIYGINDPLSDPLQLRRIVGHVNRHWLVMAVETTGLWQLFISGYRKLRGRS